VGAACGIGGTLTPALSRREREETDAALFQRDRGRRCGAGPSGRVADGRRRDGGAERVIRRKHPVVAVAMPAWRREVGRCDGPGRQELDALAPETPPRRASGRAVRRGCERRASSLGAG
jgi:hypothetical protein